ncbi:hypothetical protein PR048_010379 [Dryococelus australis]|uniref:Uncharacterized protein n=1 Tax=Dryococelus australis TaxID=614101 RepID=A0ABQ9I2K1_9NEOP|nr:hypothetical protein PR048_010379 [Dryococelus australis]
MAAAKQRNVDAATCPEQTWLSAPHEVILYNHVRTKLECWRELQKRHLPPNIRPVCYCCAVSLSHFGKGDSRLNKCKQETSSTANGVIWNISAEFLSRVEADIQIPRVHRPLCALPLLSEQSCRIVLRTELEFCITSCANMSTPRAEEDTSFQCCREMRAGIFARIVAWETIGCRFRAPVGDLDSTGNGKRRLLRATLRIADGLSCRRATGICSVHMHLRVPLASFFPKLEGGSAGVCKGYNATPYKSAIAATRRALNWRAGFSSSSGAVTSALASHHGDPGSMPACQRVFSGNSRSPRPCIPAPHFMSCPGMTGTYVSQLESPSLGGARLDRRRNTTSRREIDWQLSTRLGVGPSLLTGSGLHGHRGAAVTEWLGHSPSTKADRVQSLAGNRAAGRWVFSGIFHFLRPFIPALLHTHLVSPSSALNIRVEWTEEIWAALNIEVLRACQDPRETPLTSGIVRHVSHMRKYGCDHDRGTNPVHLCGRHHRGPLQRIYVAHTRDIPSMKVIGVSMEQRRNEKRGGGEIPEKTRRSAASPGTFPTCENPGVARLEIEPGSP